MAQIKIISFFLLSSIATSLFAQFGITSRYEIISAHEWESTFDQNTTAEFMNQRAAISINYWFRIKNIRIEFLPEAGYAFPVKNSTLPQQGSIESFYFFLNTDLYLFDIANDCNCPTFSKDGGLLEKGFFIEVSPGLTYQMRKLEQQASTPVEQPQKSNQVHFRLDAGIGFDIGISNLLTITPVARIGWIPSGNWEGLAGWLDVPNEDSSETSTVLLPGFGVRIQFRPNN
jgi:hypothetical protein